MRKTLDSVDLKHEHSLFSFAETHHRQCSTSSDACFYCSHRASVASRFPSSPTPFSSLATVFNFTIVANQSVDQCLCLSLPSFVAFNWFPNHTCQLFRAFPVTYKIQSMAQAQLYFPQRVFPNASQCCMPDLVYLLNRLRNALWRSGNVTAPRNLILDNNGYVVTVGGSISTLSRFDARNLSLISKTTVSGSYPMAIGFTNNAYFIGFSSDPIVVIDRRDLTVLNTISSSHVREVRGIIFLNQGRTMAVSNYVDQTMVFFNRTGRSPSNYTFAYNKSVICPGIHGLNGIDDTLFYATSWTQNSVYSYTSVPNSSSWNETLVIDARSIRNDASGAFVTTDECGRHWFSLNMAAVYIFNDQGVLLGNFTLPGALIFDTLITDNYVMYFSDTISAWTRIIRIDPQIRC